MVLGNLLDAAGEFAHGGHDLSPGSIGRHTKGGFAVESVDRVWVVTDEDGGHLRTMPIDKFVGGVAYSLAMEEKIAPEEATAERVSILCDYITKLIYDNTVFAWS
jgi:hypothetical protein